MSFPPYRKETHMVPRGEWEEEKPRTTCGLRAKLTRYSLFEENNISSVRILPHTTKWEAVTCRACKRKGKADGSIK